MTRATLVLAGLAVFIEAPLARASDADDIDTPTFNRRDYVRVLAGAGAANGLPTYDRTASTTLGFDVGHHPLDGALGTGFSMAWMTDDRGYWSVMTVGIFASVDLTYVFSTGLWHYDPPSLTELPVRLRLGERLGIGVSQSNVPPPSGTSYQPTYVLVRPELASYLDFEVPFEEGRCAVFERTAVDTSVNLGELFRWSFSLGFAYGFDFGGQR